MFRADFRSYSTHPRTIKLRSDIAALRRTLPASWRFTNDGISVDNELLSAMWLVHS